MESPPPVTVQSLEALITELQREGKLERKPVSKMGEELLQYCMVGYGAQKPKV